MQPSEFWDLSPAEFWLEFDMRNANRDKSSSSGLGGFSAAEWEEARKKHREKMNGRAK